MFGYLKKLNITPTTVQHKYAKQAPNKSKGAKNMKLSLHMTKNYNVRDYLKPAHIRIAVIDLDISKEYPANFVCVLPRTNNPHAKKLIQNH